MTRPMARSPTWRVAPWDLRLAGRTAALAAVASTVIALVEWITDERASGGVGTGGRAIGVLPLVPIAGAVAVAVALAPARTSGELRALAAIGAPPWRARAPAVAAAALLGLVSAMVVATGRVDVAPLFPPAAPAGDWKVEPRPAGGVSFASARRRVRVEMDDRLVHAGGLAADASVPVVRHRDAGAALAIVAASAALALWMASPLRRRPLRTLLVGAIYGAAQVAAFQSAGAGAISPLATAFPSFALLVVAVFEHRQGGFLSREEWWL